VKENRGEACSIIELRVAKEDLGHVIGKQGQTAESLRVILAIATRAAEPLSKLLKTRSDLYNESARMRDEAVPKFYY